MVNSTAFSIENRQKILEEATGNEYDFVFTKCGFKEALFSLIASGLGFKCAMFCEKDFDIELHTVVNTKDASKKTIQILRNRFPHLILPDEYLHVRKSKNRLSELFSSSIKYKDLYRYESNIQVSSESSVSIDKEFKINSNRLLMSFIKSALNNGVTILNYTSVVTDNSNEIIVSDLLKPDKSGYALQCKQLLNFDNAEQNDSKEELYIRLNRKDLYLKRSFKFYVDNELIRLIRYQDYFLLICENNNQTTNFIETVLQELSSLFKENISFNLDDIISTDIISMKNSSNLKDQLVLTEKFVKQFLNLSASDFTDRLHRLPVVDSNFEGRKEIQELIEFADFKFDEAKQTGINPVSFKNVFYRFGSETEILTELAYEWRAKYGPGEKLWQNVQLWYLYNNEMICNMNDYYARIHSRNSDYKLDLLIDEEVMNSCLFV